MRKSNTFGYERKCGNKPDLSCANYLLPIGFGSIRIQNKNTSKYYTMVKCNIVEKNQETDTEFREI